MQELSRRLKKSDEYISIIENLIDKYGLQLTVENITPNGLNFRDELDHSIQIVEGEIRNKVIHITVPISSDIVVLITGGLLAGWISTDKLSSLGDRHTVPIDSLYAMPKELRFSQPCPHMTVYGGVYNNALDGWQCLGCDTLLV